MKKIKCKKCGYDMKDYSKDNFNWSKDKFLGPWCECFNCYEHVPIKKLDKKQKIFINFVRDLEKCRYGYTEEYNESDYIVKNLIKLGYKKI